VAPQSQLRRPTALAQQRSIDGWMTNGWIVVIKQKYSLSYPIIKKNIVQLSDLIVQLSDLSYPNQTNPI
jgi:hypothetical protein